MVVRPAARHRVQRGRLAHDAARRASTTAGGPDDSGWSWFPTGASYGSAGEIGRHIDLGLTVELEEAADGDGDGEAVAANAALRLEARVDVALPTFACALVRARNAPAAPVRALLTAAPLHTYTLRDLLLARHELAEWENRGHAQRAVAAAGKAVATMLRKLSNARLLGLNLVPEHVVFTPTLAPGADGEWDLQGVGLKTAAHDLIEGEPRLTGFDARLWRRVPASDTAYDADAAWVLHGALLLGAAAAVWERARAAGAEQADGDAGWVVNLAAYRRAQAPARPPEHDARVWRAAAAPLPVRRVRPARTGARVARARVCAPATAT